MVDLFGNGLPDIVQMNGAAQFWRNLGNGLFDIPRTMKKSPQVSTCAIRACNSPT